MSITSSIGLKLTGSSESEQDILFKDWRAGMDGDDKNNKSNMQKIDEAFAADRDRITANEHAILELQKFKETDPTVPSWAKQASKPTYTAEEVGAAKADHTHAGLDKIDQDVRKAASPTFEAVTAKTITADKIIGAVYE